MGTNRKSKARVLIYLNNIQTDLIFFIRFFNWKKGESPATKTFSPKSFVWAPARCFAWSQNLLAPFDSPAPRKTKSVDTWSTSFVYSAGQESRTPHHSLENCYFTDKLVPHKLLSHMY